MKRTGFPSPLFYVVNRLLRFRSSSLLHRLGETKISQGTVGTVKRKAHALLAAINALSLVEKDPWTLRGNPGRPFFNADLFLCFRRSSIDFRWKRYGCRLGISEKTVLSSDTFDLNCPSRLTLSLRFSLSLSFYLGMLSVGRCFRFIERIWAKRGSF